MAATATGTTATATSIKRKYSRTPKQLPAPNSDFYELYETLNADELAILRRVRAFMEEGRARHHQVLGLGCLSL
jgi:hypothetical protein